MSGNIKEWCSDFYYYYTSSPEVNPRHDTPSSSDQRIVRGGDYLCDEGDITVFVRFSSSLLSGNGLRLCSSHSFPTL